MRKRKIKIIVGNWVIKLEKIDVKDFGLVEGDEVDIDDLNLLQENHSYAKRRKNTK